MLDYRSVIDFEFKTIFLNLLKMLGQKLQAYAPNDNFVNAKKNITKTTKKHLYLAILRVHAFCWDGEHLRDPELKGYITDLQRLGINKNLTLLEFTWVQGLIEKVYSKMRMFHSPSCF